MYHIPPQKLKDYEKTESWARACVDGFINIASFYHNDRRNRIKGYYDALNGYIDSEQYRRLLHFGRLNNKKFPAEIRNYPIIAPVIYRLIGEKRARPFIYNVLALNSDVESLQQQAWQEELAGYAQKLFINHLASKGMHPGYTFDKIPEPEQFERQFKRKWKDGRALAAQHLLNYIVKNEDVFNKIMLMFVDWLVAGEAYSYKEPRLNFVEYGRINPLNADFDLDPDAILIQDADWFIQRKHSHTATVIDKYSSYLTDEQVLQLERPTNSGIDPISDMHLSNPFWRRYDRLVTEEHVVWRSRKYRGRLIYIDDLGRKCIEEVDSKFNIQAFKNEQILNRLEFLAVHKKGEIGEQIKQQILAEVSEFETAEQEQQFIQEAQENLTAALSELTSEGLLSADEVQQTVDFINSTTTFEAYWDNCIWEGTRLDGRIYVRMREIPIEFGQPLKLPYNGRIYANVNSDPISMVSIGMPFQINYNIFKYRLELSVARSKDVIAVFDINMIPKKWDMDKWNHYLEGTGIAWIDFSKEGVKPNPHMQSVMNLSIQVISQYIELLEYTVAEWERVSGVSRQRQGDITQNDGLGTSQTAIQQSSYITEEIFSRFDEFIQADLQGLIECGKYTYAGGKKLTYITSDGLAAHYDLKAGELEDAEVGVFVYNGTQELQKLERAKALSERLAQKGEAPVSMLLEIIGAESYAQLKNKVQDIEDLQAEMEQKIQEAEQAAQQRQAAIQEAAIELEKDKLDREDLNKELDRRNKIQIEAMKIDAQLMGQDNNENGIPDNTEVEKLHIERTKTMADVAAKSYKNILDSIKEANKMELENKKIRLAEAKLDVDTALKMKDMELKEKQMKTDLQIARTNKNRHD